MNRTLPTLLLFTALGASGSVSAAQEVGPEPRTDANSITAHKQLLEKKHKGVIDVYFEGDSITRRWGCSDEAYKDMLANWNANFHGWNAADFAWGGDTVQNVLWSIEDGELTGLEPKVIVLQAGTNNLSEDLLPADETDKENEVVTGIRMILDVMRTQVPGATIVLTGIFPRNDKSGSTRLFPVITAINARLAALANGSNIRFVDINDKLADSNGKLYPGLTLDGLHPTVKGYQIWADALKPVFMQVMGPPAAEDHAPPPTGNPAAQG